MSAVFATPEDAEAARLGMLPSLLGGRTAGKPPSGQEPAGPEAKEDKRRSGAGPPALGCAALDAAPDAPPGLPPTPQGLAIRRALLQASEGGAKDSGGQHQALRGGPGGAWGPPPNPASSDEEVHRWAHRQELPELASEELEDEDEEDEEESTSDFDDELTDEEGAKGRFFAANSTEMTEDGLPSAGSALHASGQCSRCCFFLKNRCRNGVNCQFCHLEHERRSRGRGCRGRGTQSKEAKAAALAEQQQQQQQQLKLQLQPQTPSPSLVSQEAEEQPRATRCFTAPPGGCFSAPPGLEPPDAAGPAGLRSASPAGCTPPPPGSPRLPGAPPVGPPPFAAPQGLPRSREVMPPPPENPPGSYAPALLRGPDVAKVKAAPGLALGEESEGRGRVTASQVLLSTGAPPPPPSLSSLEGGVSWGHGLPSPGGGGGAGGGGGGAGGGSGFRPTAGPVTVASTPCGSSRSWETGALGGHAEVETGSGSGIRGAGAASAAATAGAAARGPILGTTPCSGAAMMPLLPGVPRHLCLQPGRLQRPLAAPLRTPTAAARPATPASGTPFGAHGPWSAPATPAAWLGVRRSVAGNVAEGIAYAAGEDAALPALLRSGWNSQAAEKGGAAPLRISVADIDEDASLLDPQLPAKKRLPDWML